MSKKKKQEETGNAKPFFARYLEGQDPEKSSAKVGGSRSVGQKKMHDLLMSKAAAGPVTMKAPSDKDELVYLPHYLTKDDIPEKFRDAKLMTLKYPSDRDEYAYNAEYISKAAVPKANAAAKEGTYKLKKKRTLKGK